MTPACSAALLALSMAVCLGTSGATATTPDRRLEVEGDQAVASLMACIEAAAKTLAGQTAVICEGASDTFVLPLHATQPTSPHDDRPVVALRPHLSLLNLPPPATLS